LRTAFYIIIGVSLGIVVGAGLFTFVYAKGYAYLTNDPAACANCHVMRDQYAGWMKASHHAVAGCNDCHTPPGFAGKYWTKASNGFWHSFYFTTGTFPEPIRIRGRNRAVTLAACRKCHADIVQALDATGASDCLRCHDQVGHPR
jgi:cytochrome c nitrite reductase small subunit